MTEPTTRAERMAQPTTRDAVRAVAENHGACLRPIQLRRTKPATGQVDQVLIPCGATLADICSPCATRAKELRASQCREGWHLDTEPIPDPPPPDEVQAMWVEHRAQAQADRDRAAQAGQDTAEVDALITDLDRRQAVNRLLISLVEDPEIPIFGGGERVEFLSDTPGKYSAKLYRFKSVRYASDLVLGVNDRVPKRWDERANALIAANGAGAELKAFWHSLGELPAFADVLTGKERATSRLREQTYLASSGVLYAIAWGAYMSGDITAFVKGLGNVSFARPTDKEGKVATKGTGENGEFTRADTILAGTLVDERGKISGAQNAWEAAADVLRDAATK